MNRGTNSIQEDTFFDYVKTFGPYQTRSMFGGIGFFSFDAMYVLLIEGIVYLRGGNPTLDECFTTLNCARYRHVKKNSVVTVNYYDVTGLYMNNEDFLDDMFRQSQIQAVEDKEKSKRENNVRLRDLPNMHLTIERMVKKVGITDVDTFLMLSPDEIYKKVKQTYGTQVNVNLLWKLAGAIDGCHWQLLAEPRKQELLAKVGES